MADIRAATTADWPGIESLLRTCALPLDGARENLGSFLVAHAHGNVVGTAALEVYGDAALLRSVAVDPGGQRKGLGGALVDAAIQQAIRMGVAKLYLLTTTASQFFQARGFAPVPRAAAPQAMQASAEFQGACPASAVFMMRELATGTGKPDAISTSTPHRSDG